MMRQASAFESNQSEKETSKPLRDRASMDSRNHSEKMESKPAPDSPMRSNYVKLVYNALQFFFDIYDGKVRSRSTLLKAFIPVLSTLAEPTSHYLLDRRYGHEKAQIIAEVSECTLQFVEKRIPWPNKGSANVPQ